MKTIKTCLIITTYNRPDALEIVLLSVLNQTVYPDEIIIADDGSKSETADLIKNFAAVFPVPLQHVWQEDKGFRVAAIRNKAAALTQQDYMIMIDGDIILDKHFISDHIAFAKPFRFVQGKRARLMQGATSDILKSKDLNRLSWMMSDLKFRENSLRIFYLAKILPEIKKKKGFIGANEAFWRKEFIEINGYNEDFTGWGVEDEDLCRRMINNNILPLHVHFACTGYHLWHDYSQYPQNPETFKKKKEYIKMVIEEKIKRCANGIDKYL